MKNYSWIVMLVVLMLSGCAVNMAPPPTPVSPPELETNLSSAGPANPSSENRKQQTTATISQYSSTNVPVTWGNLNLTGRLVFTKMDNAGDQQVLSLDVLNLADGTINSIFQASKNSWIYYTSVSPDGSQLIMSYAAASSENVPGNQELYLLPLDGSKPPELFISPPTPSDHYVQAEWSPDGHYVYYVHYKVVNTSDLVYPIYELYRMAYPDGQPKKIADRSFWPRVSPDGTRLAYVSMDTGTGNNILFLANADGSHSKKVTLSGTWAPDIINAPVFAPDSRSILFSALVPDETDRPDWAEKLLGIQVMNPGMPPTDWYSVSIFGGRVTRLTTDQMSGLYAGISPDGRYVARYSADGLSVMKLDGSGLTMLLPIKSGMMGTVSWIP